MVRSWVFLGLVLGTQYRREEWLVMLVLGGSNHTVKGHIVWRAKTDNQQDIAYYVRYRSRIIRAVDNIQITPRFSAADTRHERGQTACFRYLRSIPTMTFARPGRQLTQVHIHARND